MKGLQRVTLPRWCATVALIDNPTALTCFMSSTARGLPSGTLVQLWDVGVMQSLSQSRCYLQVKRANNCTV